VSTFSHSRIDTFETCPKKYEFCYVIKAPRGPDGIEAFMGSRVHDALEWLYGEVRACLLPDEEALVQRYAQVWESEWSDTVRVVREGRTPADYRAIGEKALRDYHRRYHPFDQGTTVGLELRVNMRLDDEHEIVGYIDRLVKVSDGVWEIHDYKTGATLLTQSKADQDRQLALYELAIRAMYPGVERVELVWHYLAFDHEVRSTRTPEELAALREGILAAVRRIESQTDYPTRTSRLCDWCDYRPSCPAWRHLTGSESSPEQIAAVADGATLVDEYTAVSAELSVLKARQESLRDAIAAFAAREGVDRVFGSEAAVKVYRFPCVTLPDAKDPRRGALDAEVRAMGLWDRFSSLSSYQLSRALADGVLTPEDSSRLEPYVTRSEGVKLYPGKLPPA